MKSIKIIFFALAILIVIGLVVFFSDSSSEGIDPEHESILKELNARTDDTWKDQSGWSLSDYTLCKENIDRKKNNEYINSSEAKICMNHLNEVALRKTSESLNTLYSTPSTTKSEVAAQIAGIKTIANDEAFKDNAEVKKQLAIYSEYERAVAFASSECRETVNYTFPDTWNSFSGASFRERARTIRSGRYWDVIKDISQISNGLSESTVNAKVAKGAAAFKESLAQKIISAFKSRSYTFANYDLLKKAQNKFPGSNGALNSFVNGYYGRIDFEAPAAAIY